MVSSVQIFKRDFPDVESLRSFLPSESQHTAKAARKREINQKDSMYYGNTGWLLHCLLWGKYSVISCFVSRGWNGGHKHAKGVQEAAVWMLCNPKKEEKEEEIVRIANVTSN